MKNIIEFLKFEIRMKKLHEHTPSVAKLKKYLKEDWLILGEARVRCPKSKLKKLLPLNSLVIARDWKDGDIDVKFDKTEFNKVVSNKLNSIITSFIDSYSDNKCMIRFKTYLDNKETFTILLDACYVKNEINVEYEITSIIEYLLDELSKEKSIVSKVNTEDIKQRLEIEMEFIKRRKDQFNP